MSTTRAKPRSKPKPKKAVEKLPSTIGTNPLDQLVPAAPVKNVAKNRRRAPRIPIFDQRTTVLSVTVPQSLADQVQHMLTISHELSFDELMTTSLAEVLRALKSSVGRDRNTKGSIKKIHASVYRRKH
ncbi:MAG: hypothetical protein H0W83_11950 [Planctomycetes bacterium]|nr:hypothetical protein [Planctomycetota bacterium]